jgi:hypothetical protein
MSDECSVSGLRLFPLAGVIAAKMDLTYPVYDAVDRQYIEEQMIPTEVPFSLHYDGIFEHAVVNVASVWKEVEHAVYNDDARLPLFGNWNLDDGRDEAGRLVFW